MPQTQHHSAKLAQAQGPRGRVVMQLWEHRI